MNPVDLFRVVACEVEAGAAEVISSDILKHAGLFAPIVELGRGCGCAFAFRRCEQELDDPVGIRVSQRFEQNRVDDGEDGGVCSDAEGQGCDGCDGETWVFEETAQGMREVMPQVGHWVPFLLLWLIA